MIKYIDFGQVEGGGMLHQIAKRMFMNPFFFTPEAVLVSSKLCVSVTQNLAYFILEQRKNNILELFMLCKPGGTVAGHCSFSDKV